MAKCTLERLMRAMGLAGIRRGKKTITTVSNPDVGEDEGAPLAREQPAPVLALPN